MSCFSVICTDFSARLRMDVSPAANAGLVRARNDTEVDDSLLADVWSWCFVQGCRPSKMAGRVYMKQGQNQFRYVPGSGSADSSSQYLIVSGGFLVQFSVKTNEFHKRETRHSLWGAYVSFAAVCVSCGLMLGILGLVRS